VYYLRYEYHILEVSMDLIFSLLHVDLGKHMHFLNFCATEISVQKASFTFVVKRI